MKRLFCLLLCLAAFAVLLPSCKPNDTTESTTQSAPNNDHSGSTANSNNNTATPLETEVYGYWYSDSANVVMDIIENSNAVKFYSLTAGYYEYYLIDDATYIYNKDEENLTLTLNEKEYEFIFDPYEDTLTLDKTVYVRETKLPTEHPVYTFPKYGEMDLSGVLNLPNYKEMDIRDIALAEARMQLFEEYHSSGFTSATTITDRPAQFGDLVEVDFVGKINGETFEGGSSDGAQQIKILYNSGYVPGFAEGIVGHNVGDSFEVHLTFPENYYEDVAGKDVVFEMTLLKIYDVRLTDEQFATYINLPYETYEEWVEATAKSLAGNLMCTMLYEETTVNGELPEETYMYFYQSYLDQAHYTADYYGMTYEQFCSMYGDRSDEYLEQSKYFATNYTIYYTIAQNEGLTWTEDDYNELLDEWVEELMTKYQYSKEDAILYVTNNQIDNLKAELIARIVADYLGEIGMANAE